MQKSLVTHLLILSIEEEGKSRNFIPCGSQESGLLEKFGEISRIKRKEY